jgi:SAM-dependent methyltransferase
MGWDAHGVEISQAAAEFAREHFDVEVFTGTIEQYAAAPKVPRFPLVTAIDVIEHVPNPDSFVAALARVTESGGTLIIDTPNGNAHNAAVAGRHWKGFNPFHVYLFNIANLTQLLNRHGFQVRTSYSYGNWPLDRGGQSIASMLADRTTQLLRATRLIGPVARSYFALRRLTARTGNIPRLVERTVQRINALPPWTTMPDTIAPLARHATGDNIVVVARRVMDKPR